MGGEPQFPACLLAFHFLPCIEICIWKAPAKAILAVLPQTMSPLRHGRQFVQACCSSTCGCSCSASHGYLQVLWEAWWGYALCWGWRRGW